MKIVINLKAMVTVSAAEFYPTNDEVQEFFYNLFDAEDMIVEELETTHHVGGKYIGGKNDLQRP